MAPASDGGSNGPGLPPPLITTETDEDTSSTVEIVEAVAAVSDNPISDLPSLNDAVDTDALDNLFAGRSSDGRVRFRYAGFTVCLQDDVVSVHNNRSNG